MSKTILLVEDNEDDVRYLEELLSEAPSHGYRVLRRDRLSYAMELLVETQVDIVLLDLGLPDSEGLETVHRIRKVAPETALLVLSGMEDEAVALAALRQGVQDYLIKGKIRAESLWRCIRYGLERQQLIERMHRHGERARAAENAAGEKAAILESFFRSAPVLMGIVELEDNDIRHISDNEETAFHIFDRAPADMKNRLSTELGSPGEFIDLWRKHYEEAYRQGGPVKFDYHHLTESKDLWLSVTVSPIEPRESGNTRFCYVAMETTDRVNKESKLRNAYRELQNAQDAMMEQERLKTIGQMASGIAHDINNAITPATGYADMLLMYSQNLNREDREALESISMSLRDASHIVSRMRELYKAPTDCEDEMMPISVNRLTEQVIKLTKPRWKDMPQKMGTTIDIETDYAQDLPPVNGVESEVRKALINLILNAVDAIPERGGRIRIRTYFNTEEITGNGNETEIGRTGHVVVEIVDNGRGMDERTRERCMEPFYSTKGEWGTGLGLSMAAGVMWRHQGRIQVDSVKDEGTTVRLLFPRQPPGTDLKAGSPSASAADDVEALRILYIDDDPVILVMISSMLKKEGHTVETAEDGKMAVEVFKKAIHDRRPFDVVITDLGMPEMDGRAVAKALKMESPDTPVVILTGWGDQANKESEIPAVDVFMSKPPRIADFRDILGKLSRRCN